jgi:alpha-galactosidase
MTVEEMQHNRDEANKNAGESDKAKERPAAAHEAK